MAEKTLTLRATGEGAILDALLDSFVRHHGWTPTVIDEDGTEVTNPQPQLEAAEMALRRFIRESAKSYRVNTDVEQTKKTSAESFDAAADQAELALTEE